MTFIQALILGIIQGLTEFLPISSSAHLVIAPYLLGWNIPEQQVFPFDVLVQLGTLLAVIVYFWADLLAIVKAFVLGVVNRKPFADPLARQGWLLILATIPAGLAGLLLKNKVEEAFQSVAITGLFLTVTALILTAAEWLGKRRRSLESMGWLDAVWIGVAQAVSIFPGISRSGATMAGGLVRDFDRTSAARFSFLMSIPVMLAAGVLTIKDVLVVPGLSSMLPLIGIGFLTAALVGYFSIRWLLRFVSTHSLRPFAIYCAALGLLVIILNVIFPR